jgi:hypothetical protein
VQGKNGNIESLQHKNIMKKAEENVKPVSYETKSPPPQELKDIKQFFSNQLNTQPMLSFYLHSLSQNTTMNVQS